MTTAPDLEELFESAPGYIAVVRGPDHVFEIANAAYRRLLGRDDLVGKPAREAVPGLAKQGYLELLDRVYRTGEPFVADGARVLVEPAGGGEPEVRYISFVYQPIRGEDGSVSGIFAEGIDVTAEAARREAERRLDAVLDNASVAIFLMDEHQLCSYMNAAAEALTGYRLDEALGRTLHEVIHHTRPDGTHFPIEECPIDRAFPERNRVQGEEIFVHKDGSFYPVAFTASPMLDPSGQPIGTIIEVRGTAAEKESLRALREREAHLAAFFNQSAAGMSEVDWTGRFLRVNDRYCEIVGRSREELLTMSMQDITAPEDLPGNLPLFQRTVGEGAAFEIEKRYLRPDGSVAQLAVTRDVSERKRAEEHQKLLINELNHRVKNTLAIVQGIAAQTLKGETVPAEIRQAFESRLSALAAAHDLLTTENWETAPLRQLIEKAGLGCGAAAHRLSLEGPPLRLQPKTAVSVAMAIHELCTNAVKYGALSNETGTVSIQWSIEEREGERRLCLAWREQGGPPVDVPDKRGFGTRMIERGLAAELGGTAVIDFRPEGVVCTVEAPVETVDEE